MKNFILVIILIFIGTSVSAQSSKFDDMKQKIEQKMKLNLWDEVLILATDLIIEDYTKGDGYFYSAFAFQRMGDEYNCQKYIQKAKSIADDELMKRIAQLEKNIAAKADLQNNIKDAINFELAKNKNSAANSWYAAWQMDKYKIEYALNAVSNYMDIKEYEKALEILKQPEVNVDELAKELIKKINETPKMVAINGYKFAVAEGDKYFKRESYEQAKSFYEKARNIMPNDDYVLSKLRETAEEISWQKAKRSVYVDEAEIYANSYPYGKYINEANGLIKYNYIQNAKSAYSEANESRIVEYYNKYQKRFPRDKEIEKIKTILLDFYFNSAETAYQLKQWSNAKDYYNKYLELSPNSGNALYCLKQVNKCVRKENQSSADYQMYTFDVQSPLGFSQGYLNNYGLGSYVTVKMNSQIVKAIDVIYKIDNAGNHDRPGSVVRTGEVKNANIALSAGLTFKVAYPLWAFIGAGIGYYPVYEEVDCYFSSGEYWEVDWLKNTDKTKYGIFPETGLMLKLGDVAVLKYGVSYYNGILHQVGIGYQF